MKLSLLTCTGDRPEAFALCEKWMRRQTFPAAQWVVMDDGLRRQSVSCSQEYHYVPWMRGKASLTRKIQYVFEHGLFTGDALVFIEDDDYYGPQWLQWVTNALEMDSLVGEGNALYYNVRGRWWCEHHNVSHASLCSTAIARFGWSFLHRLVSISADPFVDYQLWGHYPWSKRVYDPMGFRHTVGIKAMPGRHGYGSGHDATPDHTKWHPDPSGGFLEGILCGDAKHYLPFYSPCAK